jgi:hypothetical protein
MANTFSKSLIATVIIPKPYPKSSKVPPMLVTAVLTLCAFNPKSTTNSTLSLSKFSFFENCASFAFMLSGTLRNRFNKPSLFAVLKPPINYLYYYIYESFSIVNTNWCKENRED